MEKITRLNTLNNVFNPFKGYWQYCLDKAYVNRQYRRRYKESVNWRNPTTFGEKLCIYKITSQTERLWPYVDKFEVRKYVAKKIGRKYLNKIHKLFNSPKEIDINKLPKKFVLKATHGSGWNIICKNKKNLNWQDAKLKINRWFTANYYSFYRERQYKLIKPRIICERFLEDKNSNLPDYKFFCFHGVPKFIQIDINRFSCHRRNFYNLKWQKIPVYRKIYSTNIAVKQPVNLRLMIKLAACLAADFLFARIDFFEVNNKVYFSEITFTPGAGLTKFSPFKYEKIFGNYF